MKKFLLSFLTVAAMSSMAFAETATLDFQNWEFPGADSWGEKYEKQKNIVLFTNNNLTNLCDCILSVINMFDEYTCKPKC